MGEKSCLNCIYYKKDDCGGVRLCDDYKPALIVKDEVIKYWPKTMRSRSSYAGSHDSGYDVIPYYTDSKRKAKKKSTRSSSTNSSTKESYKRLSINVDASINNILSKLYDGVILWISYVQIPDGRYKGIALLQYKGHVLRISANPPESEIQKAMLRGIIAGASRINRPCKIYLITNMLEIDNQTDYDLTKNISDKFAEKGCDVTIVSVPNQANLVHAQVNNPVL